MPTEEEDEEDARFRHADLMLDQAQHVPTDEQGGPLFRCSIQ